MSVLWIFILVSIIMQGLHESNRAIKIACSKLDIDPDVRI